MKKNAKQAKQEFQAKVDAVMARQAEPIRVEKGIPVDPAKYPGLVAAFLQHPTEQDAEIQVDPEDPEALETTLRYLESEIFEAGIAAMNAKIEILRRKGFCPDNLEKAANTAADAVKACYDGLMDFDCPAHFRTQPEEIWREFIELHVQNSED